jgi:hypothetical protein
LKVEYGFPAKANTFIFFITASFLVWLLPNPCRVDDVGKAAGAYYRPGNVNTHKALPPRLIQDFTHLDM